MPRYLLIQVTDEPMAIGSNCINLVTTYGPTTATEILTDRVALDKAMRFPPYLLHATILDPDQNTLLAY